jgi:hypothetical protein
VYNLTDVNDVKGLQSNLHIVFDGEPGKEVMRFLEYSCGWFESIFDPINKDRILINAGKREVIATIKTLLQLPAEQIVLMAKHREE